MSVEIAIMMVAVYVVMNLIVIVVLARTAFGNGAEKQAESILNQIPPNTTDFREVLQNAAKKRDENYRKRLEADLNQALQMAQQRGENRPSQADLAQIIRRRAKTVLIIQLAIDAVTIPAAIFFVVLRLM